MSTSSRPGTLPGIEAFCRTYEGGNFTSAARALSLTPQAVSRGVARLERSLGVTLFRRTTRSLAPTDEGRRYYEICVQALSLLAAGERDLASRRGAVEGKVRISAPSTYGHRRLLPSLGAFRERFPGVEVEVSVANHNIDFVKDGYDLAIRMGKLEDGSLIARKLGDFALGVYGSRLYLARSGSPREPDELGRHECVAFVMPRSGRVLPWSFEPGPRSFIPRATYRCADDATALIPMARAGLGLIQIYDFLVEDEVASGALQEVLTAYRGTSRPFSLLYPRGVVLSPAARALRDHILAAARTARSAR